MEAGFPLQAPGFFFPVWIPQKVQASSQWEAEELFPWEPGGSFPRIPLRVPLKYMLPVESCSPERKMTLGES